MGPGGDDEDALLALDLNGWVIGAAAAEVATIDKPVVVVVDAVRTFFWTAFENVFAELTKRTAVIVATEVCTVREAVVVVVDPVLALGGVVFFGA
ncbi:MAG: hypothetical protein RIF41_19820 [Polyangiaceae bacterium]